MHTEKFTVHHWPDGKAEYWFTAFYVVPVVQTIDGQEYGPFDNAELRDAVLKRVKNSEAMQGALCSNPYRAPLINEWGLVNYK